jgi:heat shock protein HslJ
MAGTLADALDGATYVSTAAEGQDLVEGSSVRLAFEDGRLAVDAGCNTQSAAYAVTEGRLAWTGPPIGTRMACPDDLMAQDAWVAGLLVEGLDATLDGDDLILSAGDVVLHLRREPAERPTPEPAPE